MFYKRLIIVFSLALTQTGGFSQTANFELNAEKIQMYSPYMGTRHGGPQGLEQFKNANKRAYMLEMWYFTESFYIKRNHSSNGVTMNADMIDITRFEQYRKPNEDAIVELPGFKDALVLLAGNKLIYKPNY